VRDGAAKNHKSHYQPHSGQGCPPPPNTSNACAS